jgi:ribosomal protein L11 methyltransferase
VVRRVSVTVPAERAEAARARMLELFPEGFEEVDLHDGVELVAYTDARGEEHLWQAFGGVRGEDLVGDWRNRWRDFHQPVRVGELWIGPSWHDAPADATAIVIDPGRAFGTGAHQTTQLCIELLRGLEPGSLADLGCGSGVLAIVAAKLGFAPVIALDSDENAIAATRANAKLNGVELDARRADVLRDELPAVTVTVANITRQALETLAPRLRSEWLVSSGYLPTDPAPLPSFEHVRRVTQGGWAADLHRAKAQ